MSAHRRSVGDETPSSPTHVGTGLLLRGCRVGSDPLVISHVQTNIAMVTIGGLSVLKRKFVVSLGGSSRHDSRGDLRLEGTKLRARKHRSFVPIGQREQTKIKRRILGRIMSSGRVTGTVAFTRDPSDVEFKLMTEAEGCQPAFKCERTRHAVGKAKNSCIPNMFHAHHHLQTTKQSANLAQKDVIFEFPFLTDDNAPITFLEESELVFRKIGHL